MRVQLALAALLAVAGCVAPSAIEQNSVGPIDTAAAVLSIQSLLADLPCEVDTVGEATSDNILQIADIQYDGSAHGEIDARGDWLLVARYQAGGFEVVSLADPASPTLASIFQSEEENAQDVKWMPDGRTAVVGVNSQVQLVDVGPVLDAAATMTAAEILDAGIVPVLIGAWEYPRAMIPTKNLFANMHMLTPSRIAETDYVFVAPNTDTGFWVLKLVGGAFETVGNFGEPLGGAPLGPHDMSLVWDEILDKPVLYVANGFEGWMAWDVSDPAAPVQLGFMLNLDPAPASYTHTVLGAKIGDRRLVVSIAEVGTNMLKVYDATNFATPILLGVWWAEKTAPHLPQHNIQIVDGKLYVAHYAKGVYVFDLSTIGTQPVAGAAMMTPIARYLPATPEAPDELGFSNTWDVLVHKGLLYVNDMRHGTAVVGYGCLTPGDANATSVN